MLRHFNLALTITHSYFNKLDEQLLFDSAYQQKEIELEDIKLK